ncbi:MAG: FAD-dependent oxidoreductase [Pseudonocardiaceae bacterium]
MSARIGVPARRYCAPGKHWLPRGRAVVIATGSRAAVPPIEGLRDIAIWDNRDATAAKQIPARLLVLGGGAVGAEMAQAYRRLSAQEVTISAVGA